MTPDFFIAGAPRCGTTALYNYLEAHPDIAMASYKEPHYFGSDLRGERFKLYRGHEAEYQSLFKHVKNEKRVGEGSVGYLFSKKAASELYDYNPDARIIIMLRNPVDALYSMYQQAKFSGTTDFDDFGIMLKTHKTMLDDPQIDTAIRLLSEEGVRYGEQVKRFVDVFGTDAIHIILYDEFSNDTARVYRDTLQFLNVDSRFTLDSFKVINARQKGRNPLISALLRNPLIQGVGRHVPGIAMPVYRMLKTLNSKKIETKPSIVPETRQYLLQALEDDIDRLSKLIDRDLSQWKASETS